jgi:hypothetical protein
VPCSFKTSPAQVLRGGDATLTYYCAGNNARYTLESSTDNGSHWSALPGRNNQPVPSAAPPWSASANPLTDTLYRLTCRAGATTNVGGAQMHVAQPDLSSFKFKESGSSSYIAQIGDPSTLTWDAKNVNPGSCTVSGGVLPLPVSGNSNSGLPLGAVTLLGAQTYTLACQTPAMQKNIESDPQFNPPKSTSTLTVGSGVPPALQVWSDTPRVRSGALFTLNWSTTPPQSVDADSCSVKDQTGRVVGTGENGSTQTSVDVQSTFTLTCTLNGTPVSSPPFTVGLLPNYREQ